MTADRRLSARRRWAQLALAAAVALHGVVGLPAAAVAEEEECDAECWAILEYLTDQGLSPEEIIDLGESEIEPDPDAPTITPDPDGGYIVTPPPPPPPPGNGGNGGNPPAYTPTPTPTQTQPSHPSCTPTINFKCEGGEQVLNTDNTAATCGAEGMSLDRASGLCISSPDDCDLTANPGGCDADHGTDRARACQDDPKEWMHDGRCQIKAPEDDPRSEACPAGQTFYSQLGCQYPCDAGESLLNGQCVTVVRPPATQPTTPGTNPTPPTCPVGYSGTPPNCVESTPVAFVVDKAVDEGDGTASVTVALSHAGTAAATLVVSTSDGTATAGSDYTAVRARSVTIASGARTAAFDVPIIDDTIEEDDETFAVTLDSVTGGAEMPASPAPAEITIGMNDQPRRVINLAATCTRIGYSLNYRVDVSWDPPPGHTGIYQYRVAVGSLFGYTTASPHSFTGSLSGNRTVTVTPYTSSYTSDGLAASVGVYCGLRQTATWDTGAVSVTRVLPST